MGDDGIPVRKVTELEDNCFDIELTKEDMERLKLDESHVLLELQSHRDEYGVFYTAKGRQWDLWSDPDESDRNGKATAFALQDPVRASLELLSRQWRPDFDYDPDEDD